MKHVSLAVPAVLFMFTTSPAAQDIREQPPPPQTPRATVCWVPFSAVIRIVVDPGKVIVGRLYRAADGSTRNETGPSLDEINVIGIKNLPERVYYLWNPRSGWETRPLDWPSALTPPRPTEAPPGATPLADQIEGFELVRAPTDPNGVTDFLAPRLDYFAVKSIRPRS
jgi:hypothetical protein